MKTIQTVRQNVMRIGNRLHSKGLTLSQALKRAWAIVKRGIITKVKGVTMQPKAQRALQKLTAYAPENIIITLKRDAANLFDGNAVEVHAGVINKGTVKIGYLPAPLASVIAPLIDMGNAVKAAYVEIRGKYEPYMPLGLEIAVTL